LNKGWVPDQCSLLTAYGCAWLCSCSTDLLTFPVTFPVGSSLPIYAYRHTAARVCGAGPDFKAPYQRHFPLPSCQVPARFRLPPDFRLLQTVTDSKSAPPRSRLFFCDGSRFPWSADVLSRVHIFVLQIEVGTAQVKVPPCRIDSPLYERFFGLHTAFFGSPELRPPQVFFFPSNPTLGLPTLPWPSSKSLNTRISGKERESS